MKRLLYTSATILALSSVSLIAGNTLGGPTLSPIQGGSNGVAINISGNASTATTATNLGVHTLLNGALGGANNDTTVLNTIVSGGGIITFDPTNYVSGTITLANNTILHLEGATIQLQSGTNGGLFVIPLGVTNVWISDGYILDGTNYGDVANRSSVITNRIGIIYDGFSAGSRIGAGKIQGFDVGIRPISNKTTTQTPGSSKTIVAQGLECVSNTIGGFYFTFDANSCVEYQMMSGLNFHHNGINVWMQAANNNPDSSCKFNYSGRSSFVLIGGGVNGCHAQNQAVINHNVNAAIAITNENSGYTFLGNELRSDGNIHISNCNGVKFLGVSFLNSGYVFASGGGGLNFWEDGTYSGVYQSGGAVGNFTVVNDTPTNLITGGNKSISVQGNTDGRWAWATNSIVQLYYKWSSNVEHDSMRTHYVNPDATGTGDGSSEANAAKSDTKLCHIEIGDKIIFHREIIVTEDYLCDLYARSKETKGTDYPG
jgi:hypothetical protein